MAGSMKNRKTVSMLRRIYCRFPILTWMALHILLFFVECGVKKIGGMTFIFPVIAVEAVITLCISCVVSWKRTELWIYKAVRILCVLPIVALTCMLSGETIMDQIAGKDLYAEVEALYGCLKEYEFEEMKVNPDDNAVILYSDRQGEGTAIHFSSQYHDSLKYLKRKIRNARSFRNGILFAEDYTWDGDWYALYVSESPDVPWLTERNAERITPSTYDVFVPWNEL